MYTDPIADYLTRVRNAVKANHRVVEIPASNLKKEITKMAKLSSINKNNKRIKLSDRLFKKRQKLIDLI